MTDVKMSVQEFQTTVTKIRTILRSCSITGMDSMRHCSLYFLSRFLNDTHVSRLNIDKQFSWDSMMKTLAISKELSLNTFGDDLMTHFDKVFGTEKFTFEMKKYQYEHGEIMELLNDIKIEDVKLQMDMLGYIYEDHLKKGSTNARDLGQFFTDRSICNYMVALCNPTCKRKGIPETVCDPTMGTAGLLTSYMNHYGSTVDWSKQQDRVHGWDHDNKVAGFARLNLFMESGGIPFTQLHCEDSLKKGIRTTYDIILANMPFGLKGLRFAECHQSIKNLKLDGTKSEPLFLQLIMISMNEKGRCAVVVPSGMLENISSCHNETRKYLVDHFNLRRVIGINGKVFTNTAVKPYILFFEKSGVTEDIEFWEIEKLESIKETLLGTVHRSKLDEACTLNMQKYVTIDTSKFKFDLVLLSEVCKHSNGKPLKSTEKGDGQFNIMGGGIDYMGKHDKYNREANTISISKSGSAGYVKFHTEQFWAGDCFTVLPSTPKLLVKFLYYYLKTNEDFIKSKKTGSTIPHCKWEDVKNSRIPLPSLEIQKKIIKELDLIQEEKDQAQRIINESEQKSKDRMASFLEC